MVRSKSREEERVSRLLSPRSQFRQLRYLPRALRLVASIAPLWSLLSLGVLLIQGLLPVGIVLFIRDLVDAMVFLIESGGDRQAWQPVVMAGLLLGFAMLGLEALAGLSSYIQTVLGERAKDHISGLIQAKAVSLDLSFFEVPENFDRLQRAGIDALDRPLALLNSLGGLLQHTITLLAMAGVLLGFAWWMPVVLLLGTAPALWVTLRSTLKMHRWRLRNTQNERRASYFHRLLCGEQAAAEVRLFGLGGHFMQAYRDLRELLRSGRLALSREQMLGQWAAGLIALLSTALALAWSALQAARGRFTLGDLAMFYQALSQGQRLMRTLLGGVGEIYRNLLFIDDLFVFLDWEPQVQDPVRPVVLGPGLRQGLRVDDVTFRYPGSRREALSSFSLDLQAGRIAALVGENGAGKSTLLRLLCRFYDPQSGRITWDGIDLRQVPLSELRRRIAVLFQQPVPYHETAAANIAFGDVLRVPELTRIEAAAAAAGADSVVSRLPDGYRTMLGKWFGFTELSVGEWQRLALARAFLRQGDLIILDEPTSAMDAWAEMDFMTRFRQLAAGRTALIITHRLTTAMQADMIHVLQHGRVLESGSHAELVAAGGRYAEAWLRQMQESGDTGRKKS